MTSGELAKLLGVTDQTIRNWSDAWGEYLSPSATPPESEGPRAIRDYTREDAAVLSLVAEYRKRNRPLDEIREALEEGQRGRVDGDGGTTSSTFDNLEYPPVPVLVAELHQYRGELKATREERDRLLTDLDKERARAEQERAARLEAEKNASRLAGQLEVWESLREQEAQRVQEASQSAADMHATSQPNSAKSPAPENVQNISIFTPPATSSTDTPAASVGPSHKSPRPWWKRLFNG